MSDLRLAFRSLAKTPGFTLVALITLALGIGVNTSMFSLLNTMLLRPLPFPDSGQLVRLYRGTPQRANGSFTPADYFELKRGEAAFGQFAGYTNDSISISAAGGAAELQEAKSVSPDYFALLGIAPELGRVFRAEEEVHGNHRVVMLSHALWQNRFAGAPEVLGRMLHVDGEAHEIVGVLPAWANDDRVIRHIGLFRPLSFTAEQRASRTARSISIVGRRATQLSAAQGEAFVAAFGARLAADFPTENAGSRWHSEDLLHSTATGVARTIAGMLLGLSACVLLIACSNLANFLLARAIARSHELAVRGALGASRLQLLRPVVCEALLLALAGGAGALLVMLWTTDWLSAQSIASGGNPKAMEFPLDWRVLGFATAAALFTALFFGLAPGLFTSRVDLNDALKTGARGQTAGRGHRRLRHALVAGQFALATILLAGAGFLARGARNLLGEDPGWRTAAVVQGAVQLPNRAYAGDEQILAFQQRLLERLGQLPGVEAVSLSYSLPSTGINGPRSYLVEGRETASGGQAASASYNGITPGYFDVTGVPVLAGRTFSAGDTSTAPRVAIVNDTMARTLFAGENPIGRRIARAEQKTPGWMEIVGVVADVRATGVYQAPVPFQVYHPLTQEPWHYSTFAIRVARGAPETLLEPIRAAVTELDPNLPVRDLSTVPARLERATFDLQMLGKMLGAFALLGLLLATLGIYGVIARTVAQRTGEIGIRMALGAQTADVLRLILGPGTRLTLLGAAFGVLGAFALSRLLGSVMPAVEIDSTLVLAATTAALMAIGLAACYLPARTATKVDPMVALRAE